MTGTDNTVASNPNATTSLSTDNNAKGVSSRIGYGITAQVAITDHFAVAVGGYLRRLGYDLTTTITTNTTSFINGNSTTTTTTTSSAQSARARAIDVPFMLRYYGKGRHTPGARWFVEGGGAWRDINHLTSSISSTDSTGTVSCCKTNTVQPTHRTSKGIVGGAGAQFIDPFGIRVVPEVRYTRWLDQTFESVTTHTQRNQVEIALSLTF